MRLKSIFIPALMGITLAFTSSLVARADTTCPSGYEIPTAAFGKNLSSFPHGVSGAALNALFAPYGVTVSAHDPSSVSLVDQRNVYGDQAIDINSTERNANEQTGVLHNVLMQSGGNPVSYSLSFASPIHAFAFVRAGLMAGPSGVSHPEWWATAYDANANALASVHENEIRSMTNVPSRRYALASATPIAFITFVGDDRKFDGFANIVIMAIGWCR